MTPVGPERNKRIAEMIYGNASIALDGKTVLVNKEPDRDGHYGSSHAPNWSTDISAAMKLWDEMKESYKVQLIADGPISIYCLLTQSIRYLGETEADAISGCYLKWKESE